MVVRRHSTARSGAKRASDQAAARLRTAGYKIEEPRTKVFKPLRVRELNLSGALRKARGK